MKQPFSGALYEVAPPAPVLSLVVPMYNEAAGLERLFGRLNTVMAEVGLEYEIVCVDDGSRDSTLAGLTAARIRDSRVKIIALARNFGKEVALTAGLNYAAGQAVVVLDADLQHPPELIARMVEKWREGFEVVYAERESRATDSLRHRLVARAFYWLFAHVSETALPRGAGDFRLLDRKVVDALNLMPERARFMKGLFAWVGFRQGSVPYTPAPRLTGQSGWTVLKLWRFALDGVTSFSTFPLHIWLYVGIAIALPSLIYGVYLVVRTLIWGTDVPGFASIMVATLFLGGMQLLTLGIIGEYIGRIFAEVKRRPLYLVRETHGFESRAPSDPPIATAARRHDD